MRSWFGPPHSPGALQTAVACAVLVCSFTGDVAAEDPAPALVDQLSAVVREIYDSIVPGDKAVWERRLAEDFVLVDRDGAMRTKADLLAEIEPLPAAISLDLGIAETHAHDLGEAAIFTYLTRETEVIWGQTLHVDYRNTMVFDRNDNDWRLVAWQYVEVPKDGEPVWVDPSLYDAYVGEYEAAPGVTYTVVRRGGGLYGQRSGRPETELVPEGESVFYVPGAEFRKLFVKDRNGTVTAILDRRKGTDVHWRKVR